MIEGAVFDQSVAHRWDHLGGCPVADDNCSAPAEYCSTIFTNDLTERHP